MADPATAAEQDKSLDRLERQSEQSRAEFAGTVDQLRHRLSAGVIKTEAKQYVSGAGQGMLATLERKALDNPLQTVAAGAGLAYPAWRILRKMPAPILLIGAGVALAGRGYRREAAEDRPLGGGAGVPAMSQGATHRSPEQHSGKVAEVGSAISSAAHAVSDRAGELVSGVIETASQSASAASEFVSSSVEGGRDAISQTGRRTSAAGRAGRDGLVEAVENHPVLLGGLGVLVGAAIAACLPSSRTESRLFGETSDRVKEQARASASQGLDTARAAGERIWEDTVHEAQEQGLTARDAQEAVKGVGDKARAVADHAAKAVEADDEAGSQKSAAADDQDNS